MRPSTLKLLTETQRGLLDGTVPAAGSARLQSAERLHKKGYIRYGSWGGSMFTTELGKIALRAAPRPWSAPRPIIERSRDVRALAACVVCGQLGSHLPRDGEEIAHGRCFVSKYGLSIIGHLEEAEANKFTVADLTGIGINIEDFYAVRRIVAALP